MSKESNIKKELQKLNKLFKDIPENKKEFAEGLIKNAAFMAATLQELADKVNEEGAVIESTNGNGFKVYNEHPAQKSYNTMINRYTATMRQLSDMLPEQAQAQSKLEQFLDE